MNHRVWIVLGFLTSILTPLFVQADEYYSSDLYRAVEQARISTHHYDYSSALRYNRSTALSISLDPLLNQELSQTLIETPIAVDVAQSPDTRPSVKHLNELPVINNKENRIAATPETNTQQATIGIPSSVSVTVR